MVKKPNPNQLDINDITSEKEYTDDIPFGRPAPTDEELTAELRQNFADRTKKKELIQLLARTLGEVVVYKQLIIEQQEIDVYLERAAFVQSLAIRTYPEVFGSKADLTEEKIDEIHVLSDGYGEQTNGKIPPSLAFERKLGYTEEIYATLPETPVYDFRKTSPKVLDIAERLFEDPTPKSTQKQRLRILRNKLSSLIIATGEAELKGEITEQEKGDLLFFIDQRLEDVKDKRIH